MTQIRLIPDFSARTYQQTIFANSINKNTLVVLPTGLGKTLVAILLTVYYYNKNQKKILFLAPTRPLVEQQKKSFMSFFENSEEFNFQVLTGQVLPAKRVKLYKESDFIFSTPQLIENDIVNRIINPKDFCLIIFDEAHRATGNYAYGFIAEQFNDAKCNILALSASPGTSKEEIRQVMDSLKIEHIEVKRHDDFDVKPYFKGAEIDYVKVALDEEFKSIKESLDLSYNKRIKMLKELDFLKGKTMVSKRDLLDLQIQLRLDIAQGDADEKVWKAISLAAGLMKLQYGIELFESQEVSAAHSYFHNFFRASGDKSKAAEELTRDLDFREAYEKITKLHKQGVKHPKLIKLKELVNKEILENPDLRIIIFNQYRETATKIVDELSQIKEIKPALFVGQAKKGDVKLSQKDQKEIINKFRDGEYNIIVSTSVGEEGLDIPKVDLVIFYEPVPSAIRTIQRIGRTGRFKQGKAYILMTEGTRDIVTKHIASAKEKKMYKVLDELKENGRIENGKNGGQKDKGLGKFLKESVREEKIEIKNEISFDENSAIKIFVDNRENNDLIKELFSICELEVESKKLEVGDIVISDDIAIERKAKSDFVNSIIDKRLFPQLIDLAKNYKRPILIVEGKENIFALRNVNPNVIRATLSAIAVDLRMPIIFTDSMKESAQMILTITKRVYKDKKEISLVSEKGGLSEMQEIEKFVSTIPKVNVVTAKALLKHFGNVLELVNADEKRLVECEGVGKVRAKFLKEFFKREYLKE